MAENNLPIEKAPTGGEPNPFMGRNIENNPFKIDPTQNPFKGYERPGFAKRAPIKEAAKTKEEPAIFKGAYNVAEARKLRWIIGRSGGYKDFSSFTNLPPAVREKMIVLRDKIVPKGKEFINKIEFQRALNDIKRKMTYSQGNDRIASEKFLKEIELKTGIKPKPY